MYDFVLTNGTVIDPAVGLNARRNVALQGGRVAAILDPTVPVVAQQMLDCTGLLVVPGLIDFHVHVFPGVSNFGVDPDETCLARGATTVLDFGTAGGLIFDGFRRFVIDTAKTRVKALMLIAGQGLISSNDTKPALGELWDIAYSDVEGCVQAVEKHRDCVAGIKVRCMADISNDGKNEAEGLRRARLAADATKLPLVVHPANSSLRIEHLFETLRSGDVMTHCFHDKNCKLVDDRTQVCSIVREKQREGVLLDVGHGSGSFAWRVARAMLDQGVVPDFLGSDLHTYNVHGPVFDLVTTLSKFLHLGMSVPEIIRRSTATCAAWLGMADEIGTLKPGACADITVLDIVDGEIPLTDSEGVTEIGRRSFEVRHCFRAGRRVGVLPKPRASEI
ncbi:MAG: amidohydrolase/deacetylase family metallohydrolase [Planctomycetota bacterium]|nr:MAG: amidohydrolase/deacetylase family metallohydrolase [Planctomycetota bacterium]